MNIALEVFNRTANDLQVILPEIVSFYRTKNLTFYLQTTSELYKFQKYSFLELDNSIKLSTVSPGGNADKAEIVTIEFLRSNLQILNINTTMNISEDLQEFGLIRYIQNEDKSTGINFYKLIDFQDMFDSIDRSKAFINTRRIKI